jgi:hypothetical protein
VFTFHVSMLALLGGLLAAGLGAYALRRRSRERAERAATEEAVQRYVTGLLSTLALGDVRSVVLVTGEPLPRLSELSQDHRLVGWTSALPPDFDRRSAAFADFTIGYIVGLSRPRSPEDAIVETILRAKLELNGTWTDVAFRLKRTTNARGEHRLEIGVLST